MPNLSPKALIKKVNKIATIICRTNLLLPYNIVWLEINLTINNDIKLTTIDGYKNKS